MVKVLLGIPCGRNDNRGPQQESLDQLVEYSRAKGIEVSRPVCQGGAYIAENRNRLLAQAAGEGYSHCFMLDSDMLPPEHAIESLLTIDAPLVSGLCFLGGFPHVPSAFLLSPPWERGEDFPDHERWDEWPYLPYQSLAELPDEPFEVDAVGGACLFIRRDCWELMAPRPFWLLYDDQRHLPEDLLFSFRWQKRSGQGIIVHPGVEVGHLRHMAITRKHWAKAMSEIEAAVLKGVEYPGLRIHRPPGDAVIDP